MMKTKILRTLFAIPLSLPLIALLGASAGFGFHSWEVGAGTAAVCALPASVNFLLAPGPFCDRPRYVGNYNPIVLQGEATMENVTAMISKLGDQVTATLSGLPPEEQFEKASDLSYGLRAIMNSGANLLAMIDAAKDGIRTYAEKVTTAAEQAAEAKLLAKGDYIKKVDSDAAIQSAVEKKEKEIKDSLTAASAEAQRVAGVRKKLVDDKVFTQAAATALPDEFFKEEGYADRVTKLTARLKVLADNKIDNSEAFVIDMVAGIPLTAEGDKTFESRVNAVKGLVASSASRPSGSGVASLAVGSGDDGGVPALVF